MQLPTIPKIGRLSKTHKITAAGAVAATAVVLAVTGLQGTGGGSAQAVGDPTGFSVTSGQQVKSLDAKSGMASQHAIHDATAKKHADVAATKKEAAAHAAAVQKAVSHPDAKKRAAVHAPAAKPAPKKAAVAAAAKRAQDKPVANRSAHRAPAPVKHVAPARHVEAAKKAVVKKAVVAPRIAAKTYSNNLDGWIRQSLDIMKAKGIPGSYEGIHRNIIRESSGDPRAINLWDSNAIKGIPSKGLLQVIDPTFRTYHVPGTSWDIYNPVSNITAACNYAADRYGSMDNVNSAY